MMTTTMIETEADNTEPRTRAAATAVTAHSKRHLDDLLDGKWDEGSAGSGANSGNYRNLHAGNVKLHLALCLRFLPNTLMLARHGAVRNEHFGPYMEACEALCAAEFMLVKLAEWIREENHTALVLALSRTTFRAVLGLVQLMDVCVQGAVRWRASQQLTESSSPQQNHTRNSDVEGVDRSEPDWGHVQYLGTLLSVCANFVAAAKAFTDLFKRYCGDARRYDLPRSTANLLPAVRLACSTAEKQLQRVAKENRLDMQAGGVWTAATQAREQSKKQKKLKSSRRGGEPSAGSSAEMERVDIVSELTHALCRLAANHTAAAKAILTCPGMDVCLRVRSRHIDVADEILFSGCFLVHRSRSCGLGSPVRVETRHWLVRSWGGRRHVRAGGARR
jgi:hypothetical protein